MKMTNSDCACATMERALMQRFSPARVLTDTMACAGCANAPQLSKVSWWCGATSMQEPKWNFEFLLALPMRQIPNVPGCCENLAGRRRHEVGDRLPPVSGCEDIIINGLQEIAPIAIRTIADLHLSKAPPEIHAPNYPNVDATASKFPSALLQRLYLRFLDRGAPVDSGCCHPDHWPILIGIL